MDVGLGWSVDFLERWPPWCLSLEHPLFFDPAQNLQDLDLRQRKAFGFVELAIRYYF